MGVGRNILLAASKSAFLNRQATHRRFVKKAVKKFMPGESVDDAITAAEQLAREGRGTVFTQLGENLTRLNEAEAVRDHYLKVFDRIKEHAIPGHVSVKPTQLGLDLSPGACAAHLDVLGAKAMATGSTLWIDMEDSTYVDRTIALYETLRRKYERTGIAIQAYLRRTPSDLERLMALNPTIRLVKGAYAEKSAVAFPVKRDTDIAYFDLAVRMLERAARGECLPIFGTHDLGLLHRLVARAQELGVADGKYEIHMLYGIRDADQRRMCSEGRVLKTLVSYGNAWFKWYMRRLAERPANVWFVARSMLPG
jgi:proline dehydrogenase